MSEGGESLHGFTRVDSEASCKICFNDFILLCDYDGSVLFI